MDALILENAFLQLSPLELQNYEFLLSVATQPGLLRYSPSEIGSLTALEAYTRQALEERKQGLSIPFIIYDKTRKAYAGSTRFMNIDRKNRVLHIGSTWIGREFQGSGLNTRMKFLMLEYAFNEFGAEKVEFRIDERNSRSRAAVEKLGAVLEGILRRNVYLMDGFKRNTCCYGLFPEEWEASKAILEQSP